MALRYPYTEPELIEAATQAALLHLGTGLLQFRRLHRDEARHVRLLLEALDPQPGSTVLDLGCGLGLVGALGKAWFPALRFIQVNCHFGQLKRCQAWPGPRVQADIERLPLADGCADHAMLLYVLGHLDMRVALAEVVRVLKPGGRLLIWDLIARNAATPERMRKLYAYEVRNARGLRLELAQAGLTAVKLDTPRAIYAEIDEKLTRESRQALAGCDPVLVVAHA